MTYAVISNGHKLFLPLQSPQDRAQAAKNKGNKYFKAGKYENAIECYTEAIALCPIEQKTDLSTFYQNRAAAYEQQVGETRWRQTLFRFATLSMSSNLELLFLCILYGSKDDSRAIIDSSQLNGIKLIN